MSQRTQLEKEIQECNRKIENLTARFADAVRDCYDIPIPIRQTDIPGIVERMGGTYETTTLQESKLYRTKDGFHLSLNLTNKEEQNLWEFAQQIGDLYMNMHYASDEQWPKNPLQTPHKIQSHSEQKYANLFAGNLLMPQKRFREVIQQNLKNDKINTLEVARYFQVTISEAHWWGVTCGIFRPDFC